MSNELKQDINSTKGFFEEHKEHEVNVDIFLTSGVRLANLPVHNVDDLSVRTTNVEGAKGLVFYNAMASTFSCEKEGNK